MTLRPYKFIVKAIPQIVDDQGEVIGEEDGVQQVVLIGVQRLTEWAAAFPEHLAVADAARREAEADTSI